MLAESLQMILAYWPRLLAFAIAVHLLANKYGRGLNRYPGPHLAGYTNWWRFFEVFSRKSEYTHIELHRKHGDVVRLGPNVLSFADPEAIKVIYGLNKGMVKSEFYPVQQAVARGKPLQSLFSTVDEDYHAHFRRCVNGAFAMSNLISYEPLVDSTLGVFLEETERRFAKTGDACDLNKWLQFFAADVIGDLTWSKRLGFIERNEDVDGIIKFLSGFLSYAAPIGQMPILDRLLVKNPIKLILERYGILTQVFPVTAFAQARAADRSKEMENIKNYGLPEKNAPGIDLLSRFNQALHDHPEFMTDAQVLSASISMVFAGSETTAISLCAVFYYLMKNPRCYNNLIREIESAVSSGQIVDRPGGAVSFAEGQSLPYLTAVIQESFRMHPAAGLPLERVVPPSGMNILGHQIPGGTIVGCNAWVLHRRPEIFGPDVDDFRPERWLDASPEQLKKMRATMFQFGAGARTCIGKNISLLEIYKLVPSVLRRFEILLKSPEKSWKTHNAWFVRQLECNTVFRARDRSEKAV